MRRASVVLPMSLAAAGILTMPALGCPSEEQGYRRLASSGAEVAYRWDPAQLKVGQFFVAEIIACRTTAPEPVGEVRIDATMPAHGHGMNYRPSAVRMAPGHYRFKGLMLHMPGRWLVAIDLLQGGRRTRFTHEVNLKP